ncbi:MAG TPA: hypothetical protein VLA72_15475 [Anaerolineales bacterium]|nr:hypothetical protein [Anaerolineales bacterium]
MQKKPLAKLLNELEQEMLRLGYTEGSMKFYRRRWQMLLQFTQGRGEIYFSEQLGMDFPTIILTTQSNRIELTLLIRK